MCSTFALKILSASIDHFVRRQSLLTFKLCLAGMIFYLRFEANRSVVHSQREDTNPFGGCLMGNRLSLH